MFSRQVAVGCYDAQAAEGIFRCLLTWTHTFSSALLGYIDSEVFSQSITAFMEIHWNDRIVYSHSFPQTESSSCKRKQAFVDFTCKMTIMGLTWYRIWRISVVLFILKEWPKRQRFDLHCRDLMSSSLIVVCKS